MKLRIKLRGFEYLPRGYVPVYYVPNKVFSNLGYIVCMPINLAKFIKPLIFWREKWNDK